MNLLSSLKTDKMLDDIGVVNLVTTRTTIKSYL